MPTRPLPNDPSLEHLRKEAKRLRNAVRAGDADALAQVQEFHPRATQATDRASRSPMRSSSPRAPTGSRAGRSSKQHLAAIEPFVWNPPPLPDSRRRSPTCSFGWPA